MIKTNKQAPFFSVVIPVYNVERYVSRCIESVLAQDFNDYEIILVDDGSLDKSSAICDDWCKKDNKIRVIHKANAGLGMARNTGLENAKGKYIFFFDSDDYILPGLLTDVYNNIKKTESEAVFYGFKRIDREGNVKFGLTPKPDKLLYDDSNEITEKVFPYFFSKNLYTGKTFNLRISAWNCCLSIKMLISNNLRFVSEKEYISEDIYFYIELFRCLSRISFLCKEYYCYCQNEGSLTFSYKSNRFERVREFYMDILKLGQKLGYKSSINTCFQHYFISSTMSCLKMEAANVKNAGVISTYGSLKNICVDKVLQDTLKEYPVKVQSSQWKLLIYCLKKKYILLLFAMSLIQYYRKGI